MRYFEFSDDKSSKFWEITLADTAVTVRFGRIGAKGQSKTHTFADAASAQVEADKLVREKTRKGYVETTPGASTPASRPATPAPVESVPATVTEPTAAATATPAPADLAALHAEPDGALHWTAAWLRKMPVVRGEHVPSYVAPVLAAAPSSPPITALLEPLVARVADALAQGGDATQFAPASAAQWQEWLGVPLGKAKWSPGFEDEAAWVLDTALAVLGPRAAAEQWFAAFAAALPTLKTKRLNTDCLLPGLLRLRHAVATLDEADHAAVCAAASTAMSGQMRQDVLILIVLPELFASRPAAQREDATRFQHPLLAWILCDPSLISPQSQHYFGWMTDPVQPAWLLQRHRNAALPVFDVLLTTVGRYHIESELKSRAKLVAAALGCFHDVAAIDFCLRHAGFEAIGALLMEQFQAWPLCTLRRAHAAAQDAAVDTAAAQRLLRGALFNDPARAEALAAAVADDALDADLAAWLASLRPASDVAEAAPEDVPEALRSPPWLDRKPPKLAQLALVAPTEEPRVVTPGESLANLFACNEIVRIGADDYLISRARTLGARAGTLTQSQTQAWGVDQALLWWLGIRPERVDAVSAGAAVTVDDLRTLNAWEIWGDGGSLLIQMTPAVQRHLLRNTPSTFWRNVKFSANSLRLLVEQFPADAMPVLLYVGENRPDVALDAAAGIEADGLRCMSPFLVHSISIGALHGLPLLAAHALHAVKRARRSAEHWLRAHPACAARQLLPVTFAKHARSEAARTALLWLAAQGEGDTIAAAAAAHGEEATAAWQALRQVPAWRFVPAKIPPLPVWLQLHELPAPRLRSHDTRLPAGTLGDLARMIAISTPDEPHATLATVIEACTPVSLARFAEALLEQWLEHGESRKDDWMLRHQGVLADTQTVRTLARLTRGWSGARALLGMDLLARLGSRSDPADSELARTALLYLSTLTRNAQQNKLRVAAREALAQAAAERGLSDEELADMLVPELGLDERGTLLLDYGPRQYFVRFDETLSPYVVDGDGVHQKSIPRANKNDDAELAAAASTRYKALKKDVDTIAKQEIARLEHAMRQQRRWQGEDFTRLFVRHPLIRHLAQRLVWGVFDVANACTASFRLAEDLTLLDIDDNDFTLPATARVGIAHPLELDATALADWGQLLADYAILQPFQQLGRAVYAPTAAELAANSITRFAERPLSVAAVLSLRRRGWDMESDSHINHFSVAAHGTTLWLSLDPGFYVNDYEDKTPQFVKDIELVGSVPGQRPPLADADAIVLSEAIRDVDQLGAVK